jgi:phage shock protein E
MGFFDFIKGPDINQCVEEYSSTPGAVLLDVRSAGEYAGGHIPGSKNVPLDRMDKVSRVVKDKNTPVFVYCLSGSRSRQAVGFMQHMGYTNVKNIGGISHWRGKIAR